MTGTASERWRSGSAAAVAVLQATTTSFTSSASRCRPIASAKPLTSASGRGPYGSLALSPR